MSNATEGSSGRPLPEKPETLPAADTEETVSKAMRAEVWLVNNQAALESSNAFVRKLGLPLARFRNF